MAGRLLALALLAGGLAACGSIQRLDPPPYAATEELPVLGLSNARFWLDTNPDPVVREALLMADRQRAQPGGLGTQRFLALSGGSDSGAFGAGLLVGWTAAGDRPRFDVVTGISAGALIAPFAFLGPAYDRQLRSVFTEVRPSDVIELRGKLRAVLFGEALADTTPLYTLIQRYADETMLAAIAAEYAKGRMLLIGTVNLDLQRPVTWNIGAIAASGHPGALELFRRILLASAAIPGAFPPVLIDVEDEGRRYQEMHVDGGAASQVFLYPPTLDLVRAAAARRVQRERIAYVIRNGRLDVEAATTERSLLSIAGRSISTLVHFGGVNDISRIYLTTLRDGVAFRLAYIGSDFQAERPEPFDPGFMRALFDYAFEKARQGYPWSSAAPRVGSVRLPPREEAGTPRAVTR
jgi:hypothetical protein